MIQEKGAIEFKRQREGLRGWLRRSAYIQKYMDYTDYLKCRILQHFLAKLDARKSDDSNRGAIQSLQEI